MWKSKALSFLATRSTLNVVSALMNWLKLSARACCLGIIELESSTTKRTSAVVMSASGTVCDPGWMTQEPTGLKLYCWQPQAPSATSEKSVAKASMRRGMRASGSVEY